ncbi:4713_t:CDS:2 [Funneliformis geosporum]|uniref:10237_t:CDS:1 n=1 Tax=Funneliformis geosporum TaxID=1117311 RepID=A0A9W4WKP3_9GLOM|nr:10237_t:CDS:2 [Funneliformis geosporum]CAI2179094.1 4713_t:CDS:2 [Funneliformis geosporum]
MSVNNLNTVHEQVDIDVDIDDSAPHEHATPDSMVTTSSYGGIDEHIAQETEASFKTSKRATGKKRRRSPDLELLEENLAQGISTSETSEPNPKKRVLPPRKVGTLASVLADEVAADQGETTILLTSDESLLETCDVVEDDEVGTDEDLIKASNDDDKEIPVPSFRVVNEDIGSGLRSKAQEEDISDVSYEKRHRKHELAEKKLRNREREKLAYERYQQQLAVEKLRNTDSKSLISIAALRNKDATNDASKLQIAHQKLLKEAEDTLAIYDSFGLGGKKRKIDAIVNEGEVKMSEEPDAKKTRLRGSKSTVISNLDDVASKPKEVTTRITRSRKKNDELASSAVTKKLAKAPPKGKKAQNIASPSITTALTVTQSSPTGERVTSFVRPYTGMASGSRKSSRSAFAFGERVPSRQMTKKDFVLPVAIFGEIMNQREQLRTLEVREQLRQSEEYKMPSEGSGT